MKSKSEIRRLSIQNPASVADEIFALRAELKRLDGIVEAADEMAHLLINYELQKGMELEPLRTYLRVRGY